MAVTHGTQRSYVAGCRCKDCKEAHRAAARDYRERRASGLTPASVVPIRSAVVSEPSGPGAVESAVKAELAGLSQAQVQPALAAGALAMGRVLDSRADSSKPAAARMLVRLLDELHAASARRPRGGLHRVLDLDRQAVRRTGRHGNGPSGPM
jgi:hypothetical protein